MRYLDEMYRQLALLRLRRHRYPRKVRVHPLDLAQIPHGSPSLRRGMDITRLAGVIVEPDCAVPRGQPVAEYEDEA
jgi:hypothetical protein